MTLWVGIKYKSSELVVRRGLKSMALAIGFNYRGLLDRAKGSDDFEVMTTEGAWRVVRSEMTK